MRQTDHRRVNPGGWDFSPDGDASGPEALAREVSVSYITATGEGQLCCARPLHLRQCLEKRFLMTTTWKTSRMGSAIAACLILAGGLFYLGFPHGKTAKASPIPELLSTLPAGAPTLVYVDLAALRASSFYQHRPDKGPIAIPTQDYADFVRETGFDFEKDLDRVVVGSWPASAAKEPAKNITIAEGRFDREKIRAYARRNGSVEQQQGREVFHFGAAGGLNSLSFLDDHRIAMVAGTKMDPLFAAHSGEPAADPVRERATRLDGAAAFAIIRVPPIPENAVPRTAQGAAAEQFLTLARSVQWITLAARPEGDNLRVSLEGECDNSTDAHQLQSMLEVVRMFGRANLESPKTKESMDPATFTQLDSLLTSADVTQSGERVRVLLEVTPGIFQLSGPRVPSGVSPGEPKALNPNRTR
jgi:hypothetical protein